VPLRGGYSVDGRPARRVVGSGQQPTGTPGDDLPDTSGLNHPAPWSRQGEIRGDCGQPTDPNAGASMTTLGLELRRERAASRPSLRTRR
jgi:hypothetical protein